MSRTSPGRVSGFATAPPTTPRIHRYDGPAIARDPSRWIRAYEEVYARDLQLSDHCDPPLGDRLLRHARRPGFELVAALDEGTVAGYVYGYPLSSDTPWWDGLNPAPTAELSREHPGRTIVLCELLVGTVWRRGGLGGTLVEEFLDGRQEERAAALVAEDNHLMLGLHNRFGFQQVGRTSPYPGWRPHTMIVRALR